MALNKATAHRRCEVRGKNYKLETFTYLDLLPEEIVEMVRMKIHYSSPELLGLLNINKTFSGHSEKVLPVSFDLLGKLIVSSSKDCTARVWDIATGISIALLKGHREAVTYAEFDNSSKHILTVSSDRTCKIWDLAKGSAAIVFATKI